MMQDLSMYHTIYTVEHTIDRTLSRLKTVNIQANPDIGSLL